MWDVVEYFIGSDNWRSERRCHTREQVGNDSRCCDVEIKNDVEGALCMFCTLVSTFRFVLSTNCNHVYSILLLVEECVSHDNTLIVSLTV